MSGTDLQVTSNPYDPASQEFEAQTLPLDQLIQLGLDKLALELNVWRPAKVTAVKGNGRVDLEILLQAKYIKDKDPFVIPTLQDCLVGHLRGNDYWVKPPISVGDVGIALFCDRSLDAWSVQGGSVFPNDPRTHDLSDCVFIPGMYPFNAQIQDGTTDLVLHNGDSEIRIQKNGKFQIKNKQQELLDLLDQLLLVMTTQTFTLTMLGPQPFISSTVQLLNDIKQKLETLKGP